MLEGVRHSRPLPALLPLPFSQSLSGPSDGDAKCPQVATGEEEDEGTLGLLAFLPSTERPSLVLAPPSLSFLG